MLWNEAGERDAQQEKTLIGIFRTDNEASRAVTALRERDFAAQQVGASFSEDETRRSSSAKNSGKWFGELREIFHEDANAPTTWRPENLERLLVDMGIQTQEAVRIIRHAGPLAALIAVRAADRWREAKVLVEEYGGRTELIHSPSIRTSAGEFEVSRSAHDSTVEVRTAHPRHVGDAITRQVDEPAKYAPVGDSRDVVASTVAPEGNTPPARGLARSDQDLPPAEPGHIQLYGEELSVHKERVGSGDVRVRKESVTEMQTVQVPVTREHLVVEHTDGSPASRAEELRIPLSEERVRVEKDLRLREEYKVGKRDVTKNEPVTESLRRERLLIDHDVETKRE